MIVLGATLTDEIYMHQYRTARRCIARFGATPLILDLSGVRNFELSYSFLLEIGKMKPAIPPPMARYVVAPQPVVNGAARIVETLRSLGKAPIRLVRDIEDAFASLGVVRSDFVPVEI
jgi:hypothetical protein